MKDDSSKIWDSIYEGGLECRAPYTDIFAAISRRFGNESKGKNLLELGCGDGNNLMFAAWEFGLNVYGIDYSDLAIDSARRRFSQKKLPYADLSVGGINELKYEDQLFDIVIDRACIQQNTLDDIKLIVDEVHRVLKPSSMFYTSLNCEYHGMYGRGVSLGNGDFYNKEHDGMRHFFARRDVAEIFSGFNIKRWVMDTRLDMFTNNVSYGVFNIEMEKKS